MATSDRQARGAQQRAHLRNSVAPAGRATGGPSLSRVTAAAAWWARQDRWGRAVTAPAHHILATVHAIRSAPGSDALQYELGTVIRNYSEFLVRELHHDHDGILPEPSVPLRPAEAGDCPVCGGRADVTAGSAGDLAFQHLSCDSCGAVVTTTEPADWFRFGDATLTVSPGAVLGVDGVVTTSVSVPTGGRRLLALKDLGPLEVR